MKYELKSFTLGAIAIIEGAITTYNIRIGVVGCPYESMWASVSSSIILDEKMSIADATLKAEEDAKKYVIENYPNT